MFSFLVPVVYVIDIYIYLTHHSSEVRSLCLIKILYGDMSSFLPLDVVIFGGYVIYTHRFVTSLTLQK